MSRRGRSHRPRPPASPADERLGAALRVERLVPGGEGLARAADGRAVFVPGGLPDDLVRPKTARVKKSWARLEDWELLEASPTRREPPCPAAATCGGCDWMALPEAEQRRWKAELVQDAFRRIAGSDALRVPPARGGLPAWGYRSRLRVHLDPRGRAGLHARGTRDVVQLTDCPVATDEVRRGLAALGRLAESAPDALAGCAEIELRSSSDEPRLLLVLHPREGGELGALEEALAGVGVPVRAGALEPAQRRPTAGDATLSVGPSTFSQVHEAAAAELVDAALEALGPPGGRLLELYAGAGQFTLPLLAAGWDLLAVEASEAAVEDGRRAARDAGLPDVWLAADATQAAAERLADGGFTHVLLDPPRSGAPDLAGLLAGAAVDRVVMVSCDPGTAARDCRTLLDAGYRLEDLQAFDLFPQTHHVELLAVLTR